MQRMKRSIVWLMLSAMLGTLLPTGLDRPAHAAPSAATYFIPDIVEFRNTALLTTEPGASQITRENVYKTNNPALTITGTYSHVSKDTLSVKIEQLTSVPVVGGGVRWVTDSTTAITAPVTADTNSTNKYTASNMTLFSGFNKITFNGLQGNVERSDTFYVLYDKVPFLENLQLMGSGSTPINLNEGTHVVVTNQTGTLQGSAKNATQVTVALNGATALMSSLLDDGTFFTPALNFKPGLNTIELVIQNASDSIKITRGVYYFDKNEPFTNIDVVHGGNKYPAIGKTPTLTNPATDASLEVEILVPYHSDAFGGKATYSLAGQPLVTVSTGDVISEIIIPGPNGVTPAYRLVKFKTQSYTVASGSQSVNLVVTYDTFSSAYNVNYRHLPNETVIIGMDMLPGYNGSDNVSGVTRIPLQGSQTEKADFYIVVKADKTPTSVLEAKYLPLGTNPLNITRVSPQPPGLSANEEVYRITGFSNGQQKVGFNYIGSTAIFTADISYVSKNYIYVANLQDGQTYSFDSRLTHSLNVTGEYIGFENINSPHFNAQVFVNGLNMDPNPSSPGSWLTISQGKATFNLNFQIDAAGHSSTVKTELCSLGPQQMAQVIPAKFARNLESISLIQTFQPFLSLCQPFLFQPENHLIREILVYILMIK
ncbi:hypothetical protein [Paenibacillus sp. BR1-192]|uniref:hypothetical protein n=1 Tax=Paenibacillus sp. BR1-192 TaxID=3032287 RepID=UPI00240D8C4A|nr:hypothetical protein [Paenibacillus sp. BR1-192]WFB58187.1 hypothetical protein P0X86_30405 [Paenibacillus sp. BR1-192]